jgi:hypothetical protein
MLDLDDYRSRILMQLTQLLAREFPHYQFTMYGSKILCHPKPTSTVRYQMRECVDRAIMSLAAYRSDASVLPQ